MIANHRDHLRLLRARVVGEGKTMRSIQEEHDILGFEFGKDSRVRPLTILGFPNPNDGWTYAIFNERQKSWTKLDGTVYSAFPDFLRPLYEEAERRAGRGGLAGGVRATAPDSPGGNGPPQHASDGEGSPTPPEAENAVEAWDANSPGANWDHGQIGRPRPWKSTAR